MASAFRRTNDAGSAGGRGGTSPAPTGGGAVTISPSRAGAVEGVRASPPTRRPPPPGLPPVPTTPAGGAFAGSPAGGVVSAGGGATTGGVSPCGVTPDTSASSSLIACSAVMPWGRYGAALAGSARRNWSACAGVIPGGSESAIEAARAADIPGVPAAVMAFSGSTSCFLPSTNR